MTKQHRTRPEHPVLVSLWIADEILRHAARVDGPRGVITSMEAKRGARIVADTQIEAARWHLDAVSLLDCAVTRRVVALAAQSRNGRPVMNIRDISTAVGIGKSTAQRKLALGLEIVGATLQNWFDRAPVRLSLTAAD